MSVMEEGTKLLSQKVEENASRKQKNFFWDSVIFSTAVYILGLSVSSIMFELF